MNGTTNPLYIAYMALHLANKTIDEIPFDLQPYDVKAVYAENEDVKSNLWGRLTTTERNAIRKYNKENELG